MQKDFPDTIKSWVDWWENVTKTSEDAIDEVVFWLQWRLENVLSQRVNRKVFHIFIRKEAGLPNDLMKYFRARVKITIGEIMKNEWKIMDWSFKIMDWSFIEVNDAFIVCVHS